MDLTRERERYSNWMSLQPSRSTQLCIVEVLRIWKFLEQKNRPLDLNMECPQSSSEKQLIDEWSSNNLRKAGLFSSFINATLGIYIFAIWTDKSMEAKLGNGTIDAFLVHDLRVMYRKAVTVLYLSSWLGISMRVRRVHISIVKGLRRYFCH
jgi:hypothetical protein